MPGREIKTLQSSMPGVLHRLANFEPLVKGWRPTREPAALVPSASTCGRTTATNGERADRIRAYCVASASRARKSSIASPVTGPTWLATYSPCGSTKNVDGSPLSGSKGRTGVSPARTTR